MLLPFSTEKTLLFCCIYKSIIISLYLFIFITIWLNKVDFSSYLAILLLKFFTTVFVGANVVFIPCHR